MAEIPLYLGDQARKRLAELGYEFPGTAPAEIGMLSLIVALAERVDALEKQVRRDRCRHPACLDNEDDRCPDWLTGDCPGPNGEK